MADPATGIPWQGAKEWQSLTLFFDTIKKVHTTALDPVHRHAGAIRQLFESLSRPMDDLCAATCVTCRDICCQRATIWYDFKDLVYLYFAFDRLPETQITKIKDATGKTHCSHFSTVGCRLSRLERPFVCTWYLCPDQKLRVVSDKGINSEVFSDTINQIKRLRSEMVSRFCLISAGKQD